MDENVVGDPTQSIMPRYPVYIISKGRADMGLTANFLIEDGVPFHLVIEPQEFDAYAAHYDPAIILVLPFSNLGLGGIPARNWVWEHAKAAGYERHWILDDNIKMIMRRFKGGRRVRCNGGVALAAVEDFIDRYENIAVAGLNYSMFIGVQGGKRGLPPFYLNCHVYSCLLIKNDIPNRWRGRYNEDTDLCLQVLADGWCTILINAFAIAKVGTMTMKGGNSDQLYKGDGRLKMARSLERMWPGVVETKRRFDRPQHVVASSWGKFDTQLILKPGVDLALLQKVNDYGMKLVQVSDEIKNSVLRGLVEGQEGTADDPA